MGLFLKKELQNNCILAIWKIEEDYESIISSLNLDKKDTQIVEKFKDEDRKIEWLSVRLLLKELYKKDVKVNYNDNGKPYLKDYSSYISISHSNDFVGVIIGKKEVGLDIEYMSKKIGKIALRFLSSEELNEIDLEQEIKHLYLHWCAKETLFKIHPDQLLKFKEHLKINSFKVKNEGQFEGIIDKDSFFQKYILNYVIIDKYAVVWCY